MRFIASQAELLSLLCRGGLARGRHVRFSVMQIERSVAGSEMVQTLLGMNVVLFTLTLVGQSAIER
jgi:hypothetical protein